MNDQRHLQRKQWHAWTKGRAVTYQIWKNYQIYGQSKTSNSISTTLEIISFQEGISCIKLARNTCSNSHHHNPNTWYKTVSVTVSFKEINTTRAEKGGNFWAIYTLNLRKFWTHFDEIWYLWLILKVVIEDTILFRHVKCTSNFILNSHGTS